MRGSEETQEIADLVDRLGDRFPQIAPEYISEVVGSAHRRYDGKPIRDFVPVLVEHDALNELRSFAKRQAIVGHRKATA